MEHQSGGFDLQNQDSPAMDAAAFRHATLDNAALQKRILALCLTTTEGLDWKIEQQVVRNQPEAGQTLHFCKGVFMNVRASRLVATLEAMESALHTGDRDACIALVPSFLDEFSKARNAVSGMFAELEGN